MRGIAVEINVICTDEHCDNCIYDNGRYLKNDKGKINMWCMRFIKELQPMQIPIKNGVKNDYLRCPQCLAAEVKGDE